MLGDSFIDVTVRATLDRWPSGEKHTKSLLLEKAALIIPLGGL